MLSLLCLLFTVEARWHQQKALNANFSTNADSHLIGAQNASSSLTSMHESARKTKGKAYPVYSDSAEDDKWKDAVLGEGEDVLNRYSHPRADESDLPHVSRQPIDDAVGSVYQPEYRTERDRVNQSEYGTPVAWENEVPSLAPDSAGSESETVGAEVGSEQKLQSSSTSNSSASTEDEGSSSVDPSGVYNGAAQAAGQSGPFGVSIGTWCIIGLVLLLVIIAIFFIRKYIRAVVGCVETSCYWTCKALAFPFLLLWNGIQALAYPVKEFVCRQASPFMSIGILGK